VTWAGDVAWVCVPIPAPKAPPTDSSAPARRPDPQPCSQAGAPAPPTAAIDGRQVELLASVQAALARADVATAHHAAAAARLHALKRSAGYEAGACGGLAPDLVAKFFEDG
jgi:hypothetical protein